MKRQVRHSKHDPLVDEVELIEANHQYAHVKLPDGRETTVSTRSLAPMGEFAPVSSTQFQLEDTAFADRAVDTEVILTHDPDVPAEVVPPPINNDHDQSQETFTRRSERTRRQPSHLQDFFVG